MKQINKNSKTITKVNALLMMFLLVGSFGWAQNSPEVKVNGNDVGSWFGQNWIWIAGLVLLLILILLFSSGKSKSRTTNTIVRDEYGDVKRSTITETEVE